MTYRDHAGLLRVLILDSWSLAQARLLAELEGADHGARFHEGHEVDCDSAVLVPLDMIGRMLSLDEASEVVRRLERAIPKRSAAASVKRRGMVRPSRRADVTHPPPCPGHRPGLWGPDDYDVVDGGHVVGRIFLDANDDWFWAVDFMLTHRKSYGTADTLDAISIS